MRWHAYLGRLAVALTAFVVVCGGMVAMFGAMALAIDWEIPEPQELLGPSSLFDRNGVPLYRFAADVERRVVPLDAISEHLHHAVVAAEDHRFYEHQGVDPFSVVRAVVRNVRSGGIREGGSTLTQQFVKNVYVGADRSFYRKVREAVVALQLEKDLEKREILEGYLNRVYFGDGAYGAEAAALTYFGKPAADLTLGESATLASVLTSPSRLSPRSNPDAARPRRDRVLDQMTLYGFVTAAEAAAAKAEPLDIVPRSTSRPFAPYYVEEIRRQLLVDPAFGPERLYNGGLIITAALDVEQQRRLTPTSTSGSRRSTRAPATSSRPGRAGTSRGSRSTSRPGRAWRAAGGRRGRRSSRSCSPRGSRTGWPCRRRTRPPGASRSATGARRTPRAAGGAARCSPRWPPP
jgi:penicillin-binding protein 1A